MKYYIASDHGGVVLKDALKDYFDFEWVDLGTDDQLSVDYPDYAHKLAKALEDDTEARGILICGTGIGISIAANRHAHIRAALCTNEAMARLSREHNNANVLVLGERITGIELAKSIVQAFVEASFEGGRHATRVEKINL